MFVGKPARNRRVPSAYITTVHWLTEQHVGGTLCDCGNSGATPGAYAIVESALCTVLVFAQNTSSHRGVQRNLDCAHNACVRDVLVRHAEAIRN